MAGDLFSMENGKRILHFLPFQFLLFGEPRCNICVSNSHSSAKMVFILSGLNLNLNLLSTKLQEMFSLQKMRIVENVDIAQQKINLPEKPFLLFSAGDAPRNHALRNELNKLKLLIRHKNIPY